jgi:hypothetical protein
MPDFDELARPHVEALLEPGEALLGVLAANQQSTFSGKLVAIGVTDRRLLVQALDRHLQPRGESRSITHADIASVDSRVAGSEWWNTELPVTNAALTMRLRTTSGDKLTLHMMRGGDGLLGRLGGGETQERGIQALAEWMRRGDV